LHCSVSGSLMDSMVAFSTLCGAGITDPAGLSSPAKTKGNPKSESLLQL